MSMNHAAGRRSAEKSPRWRILGFQSVNQARSITCFSLGAAIGCHRGYGLFRQGTATVMVPPENVALVNRARPAHRFHRASRPSSVSRPAKPRWRTSQS
jgi:hypothetical protein